jgi:polyhydroxyalkanoate synthesis regulator phasin
MLLPIFFSLIQVSHAGGFSMEEVEELIEYLADHQRASFQEARRLSAELERALEESSQDLEQESPTAALPRREAQPLLEPASALVQRSSDASSSTAEYPTN